MRARIATLVGVVLVGLVVAAVGARTSAAAPRLTCPAAAPLSRPCGAGFAPQHPYLAAIAAALMVHSPLTEGRLWWESAGNSLPAGWLLPTPDCFGVDTCPSPPPGAAVFLARMRAVIGQAHSYVDIADLYPPPDGKFFDALVSGLKTAVARPGVPGHLVVRVMVGLYTGAIDNTTALGVVKVVGRCAVKVLDFLFRGRRLECASFDQVLGDDFATALRHRVPGLQIQVAYWQSHPFSWDHEKAIDVDGKVALVGGMNYWTDHYVESSHPINDLSMQIDGPAAAAVVHFDNYLWRAACNAGRKIVYLAGLSNCVYPGPMTAPTGRVGVITVGRLGVGIGLPPSATALTPPPIPKPLASGNCGLAGNETNFSTSYQHANPGDVALRTLVGSAKHSIFIDQQDLFSCLFLVEATYDDRLFEILANKILHHIPITIVVSEGASKPTSPIQTYHNGLLRGIGSLAWALARMVELTNKSRGQGPPQPVAAYQAARQAVCNDVSLAYFKNVAGKRTWADGHLFGSHDKVVSVDDEAFYIGSENLYPARLQELGLIVEDHQAAMTLQSRVLTPTWDAAKGSALINPATRTCAVFDPLPANQRPPDVPRPSN